MVGLTLVAQASYRTSPAPFGLAVSGEASEYVDALRRIVGSPWLETYPVDSDAEMLELVRGGLVDAAVLDETAMRLNALQMLRMIHRLNETMLVVILTVRPDRRLLEQALNLAAFSVVCKPLHLEVLLCQIHRMMTRLDEGLRRGPF